MKFSVTQENLQQGLAITSHISTKNVNLPILNNVLVRAGKGGLKLISTNLEMTVTCHVRGKVEQEGEYTVPSKLFFDYVNLLPNDRIDVDLLDDSLSVVCGRSKTKINGIASSEFPLVPPVEANITYSVSVSEFKKALGQVLFAAATNEARLELAGAYMAFHGQSAGAGTLTMAATDSYRLAECIAKVSSGSDQARDVIVPSRTLAEWNRIMSVFKDDVEAPPAVDISLTDNQILFQYGAVELSSPIIEKTYPDYRQIIPTSAKSEIVVDRQEFAKAIKTASLFSKTGLFDITLNVFPDSDEIELSATDASRGANAVRIPAQITGEQNTITLNYRFLLDGANAIDSSEVHINVIDGANPCVMTPKDMPDVKYQYVVMPIRQ